MAIRFACEGCGKDFTVKDELGGKSGKCSDCGTILKIPLAASSNIQVIVNQDTSKSANGLGVAAFILGIFALLICWIPLISLLAFPLIFVGGVLALVGLVVSITSKKSSPGWAIAGVALNACSLIILIFVNVLAAHAVASGADQVRQQLADQIEQQRLYAMRAAEKAEADSAAVKAKNQLDLPTIETKETVDVDSNPLPVADKSDRPSSPVSSADSDTAEEKAAREKIANEMAEKVARQIAERTAKRDAAAKEAAIKARPGRAAALLDAAKNFQFDGKTEKALEYYQRIVKEFGDTPSAKEAAQRIKGLTGK